MTEVETHAFKELVEIAQLDKFEIDMLIQREVHWFETIVIRDSNSDYEGKKLNLMLLLIIIDLFMLPFFGCRHRW